MGRITAIIGGAAILVLVVMALLVNYYRDNAITYKEQRDKATSDLKLAKGTITDMQVRQRDVAALDAKYTGELVNAQATIDQLERDVAAGKRRMRVAATCPADGTTSTGGVGDATSPRLTDAAQQDYFTLRERIVTVTKQVGYLQAYIKEQCIK